MISINTNLSSLITQSNLKSATNGLNQAIERMTMGFKINHAKDNAANHSISTNMSTKISAYQVAEDNASMGLDMLNTATGSLDLLYDGLSRLRALQEQASNGTYGKDSLEAINAEANAIVDEMERTMNTSTFNGIDVLRGQETGTETSEFIKDIKRRDTSGMTKLSAVSDSEMLTGTYSIGTKDELAKLATMTNNGLVSETAEFVMSNDIDLENMEWTPIGKRTADGEDLTTAFKATFDGNGYIVSNLKIDNSSGNFQGLFGSIYGADISNVGIDGANIHVYRNVGSLVGIALYSDISNCYVKNGNIECDTNYVGGLIGNVNTANKIDNSYALADISGRDYVGGVCGMLQGRSQLSNSFAQGTISGQIVGGISGAIDAVGMLQSSFFNGIITGTKRSAGLVASIPAYGYIDNCYAILDSSSNVKAGLVDAVSNFRRDGNATISNSYILGNATLSDGILVREVQSGMNFEISNCGYSSNYASMAPLVATGTTYTLNNVTTCSPDYVPFEITSDGTITNYNGNSTLQVGINSNESSQININLGIVLGQFSSLRNVGSSNSSTLLSKIDKLLSQVSAQQTKFGATQNRLESALEEISIQYENLVSSRSTIRDADIAEESSSYIKMQILQQASVTLLATANQTPSIALQLL